VFATHVAVATPVQQQRRRLDALQRGADVGAHEHVVQRLEISRAAGEPLTARPPAPRLAASPAQLGASRSTIAPVPTVCSKLSTYFTRADSGMPNGWSEARRKRANGLQSTSERTRCGWLAVSSMIGSPDSDHAKTDAHLLPTASSTATSPSVQDCIAGRSWIGTASELPLPRRSVKMRRLNEASRCRWPRHRGLVPQQVDRERRGGHEEKIGAAVPDDLVREVGVAVPRVERLRSAPHAVSMARRHTP